MSSASASAASASVGATSAPGTSAATDSGSVASDSKEKKKMKYMRLGKTGMKVSRICLGCMSYGTSKWRPWVLNEPESRPFFQRAFELGINFFDTANMYSEGMSEVVLGNAIREFSSREDVVIASKVYFPMPPYGPNDGGLSRKHIFQSVEASLKRLGTDYIDLYQIHRWDNETPIEETMEALNDLVRIGKVRYIGASSMAAWQFCKAQMVAENRGWTKFVSMQNHYNLVYREEEREMIPFCASEGVGIIPWSPLARGFLAGNRSPNDIAASKAAAAASATAGGSVASSAAASETKGAATTRTLTDNFAHKLYYDPSDFKVVDAVVSLAATKGVSAAQLSLAWLLHKQAVVAPIIGATKISQLEEAVAAVHLDLSKEDIAALEEPYKPHAPNS